MRKDLEKAWNLTKVPSQLGIKLNIPRIEDVEQHLSKDEEVKCVLKGNGVVKRSGGVGYKALPCVAVLTNKSIYLFRQGQYLDVLAQSIESIPLHTVTGLQANRQFTGTVFEITRAGNNDKMGMCDHEHAQVFRDLAKEIIENMSSQKNTQSLIKQELDPIEQIKKLKDLLDSGIISQKEFDEKKQILMDKI